MSTGRHFISSPFGIIAIDIVVIQPRPVESRDSDRCKCQGAGNERWLQRLLHFVLN
jgi:hypothetical protein